MTVTPEYRPTVADGETFSAAELKTLAGDPLINVAVGGANAEQVTPDGRLLAKHEGVTVPL